MPKNYTSADLLSNYRKSKIKKKKNLKKTRGIKLFTYIGTNIRIISIFLENMQARRK